MTSMPLIICSDMLTVPNENEFPNFIVSLNQTFGRRNHLPSRYLYMPLNFTFIPT